MIAPSRRLNPVPPISAEHAAAMVVRGLVEKPARIDTPVGTLADVGNYFTPKLSVACCTSSTLAIPTRRRRAAWRLPRRSPTHRPGTPSDRLALAAVLRVPGPVKRAVRLVPGVHW